MNQIKTVIISTMTTTITGVISWFGIKSMFKHYEQFKQMKHDIDFIKVRLEEHKKMFEDIENTFEGVAYAIPYNNTRAWQHKIVQKKMDKELKKLEDLSDEDSSCEEVNPEETPEETKK